MKYKEIGVSISHESANAFGLKMWKKYNLTVEVGEGEDVDAVKNEVEQKILGWHNPITVNPEYAHRFNDFNVPQETFSIIESVPHIQLSGDSEQAILARIESATDPKTLETEKFLSRKFPSTAEAYRNKLIELQK